MLQPNPQKVQIMATCQQTDCYRTARRGGRWCSTHEKRAERDQDMSAPVQPRYESPAERIYEAAYALADAHAESEEAWERAQARFRMALRDATRSQLKRLAKTGTGDAVLDRLVALLVAEF